MGTPTLVEAQAELGSLEALEALGVRGSAKGDGDSNPCQGAVFSGGYWVYWGRSLRSLTGGGAKAPYWGARERKRPWELPP